MTAAAFEATYSDWKLIRTRKCVQIVLEVPLEKSDEAYDALGGMPNAGAEVWVGVARLDPSKVSSGAVKEAASNGTDSPVAAASKKSWHEMSGAQQAGILCADQSFRNFLRHEKRLPVLTESDAATVIRNFCGVGSRLEITPESSAGRVWRSLVSDYRAWMREAEYVE